MHIVMIGQKGLPPHSGGIERHVYELARGLVCAGHRVTVYGRPWYTSKAGWTEGVRVRLSKGIHTKHLDAITHGLTSVIDAMREHPDVIHLHGSGAALLVPLTRLLHPRARTVVTFHCIDRTLAKWNVLAKLAFRIGEWFACYLAHRTIVVSQQLALYCLRTYGCQVTYIPHPLSIPAIEAINAYVSLPHGLQPERYFLCVTRLIPDKQIHTLIHAYADARRSHPERFAGLPLVIAGAGSWTNAYVRRIRALASKTDGVHLLGERSGEELRTLQAQAYAHVLPSASEGLAFALLEAASFRRPIVMTDLPQNLEATGGNGILVKPADQDSLMRGLVQVSCMPLSVREHMGRRLYEHVALQNCRDTRVAETVQVYRETVGEMPIECVAVHTG